MPYKMAYFLSFWDICLCTIPKILDSQTLAVLD